MKLYNIKNPEALFAKLDECEAPVELVLADGKYEWKDNENLVRSLWKTMPEKSVNNLEVRLNNTRDTARMLDYLMRGNCA